MNIDLTNCYQKSTEALVRETLILTALTKVTESTPILELPVTLSVSDDLKVKIQELPDIDLVGSSLKLTITCKQEELLIWCLPAQGALFRIEDEIKTYQENIDRLTLY